MGKLSIGSKLMLLVFVFLLAFPAGALAATEQTKISNGVQLQKTEGTVSGHAQSIHNLVVDLNDSMTTVDVGYPFPLNKLVRTTVQANAFSKQGQLVTGAINGSYFWGSDQGYLPMYLISYRDRLINAGIIASGYDQYVNQPIAFGIDKSGKGKIDTYNLDLTFTRAGQTYGITSTDKTRTTNNMILYTPLYPHTTTQTNELGVEVVISGVEGGTELHFGETVTGTVTGIRNRGDKTASTIPKDGFVLSAHGDEAANLKDIQIGEQISVSANIDDAWKGASFMLTSGPELVKNGQVSIAIDPNSDRAKQIAPRTAIAVDKTGTKVFMVTVDGRQVTSRGMTFKELANYLVSIGADSALALDGGGSTTMAVRKPGDVNVSLFNRPSDGSERAVSTALFALSTAPVGTPTTVLADLTKQGVYLKGTKGTVQLNGVMDNHFNPVTPKPTAGTLSSDLISANGLQFTAAKAGKGAITVKVGNATGTIPFEVVDTIAKVEPSVASLSVRTGEKRTLSVKAFDASNRAVIYDSSLVTWKVPASVGTISANGEFTAANTSGSGNITATIGGKTISIPVTITGGEVLSVDSFDSLANWQATSVNGTASLSTNSGKESAFEGTGAAKLTYDFRGKSGTSAAYIEAKKDVPLGGSPVKISARVFGDASKNWLRGRIVDSKGQQFTIDFTKENGLKWIGWNYVTATIPAEASGDISLQQIYIAQPTANLKTAGSIMIDDLKAVYNSTYQEGLFKDTGLTFRAEKEISALVNEGVIAGYANGTFGPYDELTRQQAAILIARAKNLNLDNLKDPGFTDMQPTMTYYKEVAAVANAGIIRGKENGTKFDPNGKLTRAEMAAILQRGFQLPLAKENYFSDIKGSFAYDAINSLAVNNITQGIGQGKFGPALNITRADFSVFLYRAYMK